MTSPLPSRGLSPWPGRSTEMTSKCWLNSGTRSLNAPVMRPGRGAAAGVRRRPRAGWASPPANRGAAVSNTREQGECRRHRSSYGISQQARSRGHRGTGYRRLSVMLAPCPRGSCESRRRWSTAPSRRTSRPGQPQPRRPAPRRTSSASDQGSSPPGGGGDPASLESVGHPFQGGEVDGAASRSRHGSARVGRVGIQPRYRLGWSVRRPPVDRRRRALPGGSLPVRAWASSFGQLVSNLPAHTVHRGHVEGTTRQQHPTRFVDRQVRRPDGQLLRLPPTGRADPVVDVGSYHQNTPDGAIQIVGGRAAIQWVMVVSYVVVPQRELRGSVDSIWCQVYVSAHLGGFAAGNPEQLGVVGPEDVVGVAGRRPKHRRSG